MEVVLIPRNVFAIWRSYFGFRLKHFSMVGDTAFYAFRERIQREIFRNVFCFLIVTGLWVKRFLIWAAFSKVLSIMHSMCPEEDLEVRLIFFQNNWATISFGNWTKNFVIFLPIFSRIVCKKWLVPFQTNTFKKVIFSENFHFGFLFGFWAANIRQACQKMVYVARRTTEECGFYFKLFDSWYRFLTMNNFFWISPDIFQQRCQYCKHRVEMNNLRRKLFFE